MTQQNLKIRASNKEIQKKRSQVIQYFFTNSDVKMVLDSVMDFICILDSHRQAVFVNQTLLDFLNCLDINIIIGKRFGEIIHCIHSDENDTGCGTTDFCEKCGALAATLASLDGGRGMEECRVTTDKDGKAIDLGVITSPLEIDGDKYVIAIFVDISNAKRRGVLERIVFHDILNIASVISNIAHLIIQAPPDEKENLTTKLFTNTLRLIEEIKSHQILAFAEKSELKINFSDININELVNDVALIMKHHPVCNNKKIVVKQIPKDLYLTSDKVLLKRILINLLKNALEASEEGKQVTIGATGKNKKIIFSVHNSSYMPKEVQLQIFRRSFSTKGAGRGLGTYSAKLFTETYLDGEIWFETKKKKGTTFHIKV